MLDIDVDFVQDNHSRSSKGVLRGLHFQRIKPQGKLTRVVCGEVYDVVVDIRVDSPTYKNGLVFTCRKITTTNFGFRQVSHMVS
jgi:dTDP-4-dehydrorhamnose 3,5-epimerase